MHAVAAPDKFRGTATAAEVADAMAAACESAGWTCTPIPLADGGEGTLEALGGANRKALVCGPLGEPVSAAWRLDGNLAVIEMAQASGLLLAGGAQANDPMAATSRGTGELILLARRAGARRVVVGAGGSACTDGGLGAVEVLEGHGRLDGSDGFEVVVATDVTTRFVDAAGVFAPQKGATPVQVDALTTRLASLAEEYRRRFGAQVLPLPGGGAAGGLAGGLAALGARIESGFDLVAGEVDLASAIEVADLVITGEGRLDDASFEGKVVGGVLARARSAGATAGVVAGQALTSVSPGCRVVDLSSEYGMEQAMLATLQCVGAATRKLLEE